MTGKAGDEKADSRISSLLPVLAAAAVPSVFLALAIPPVWGYVDSSVYLFAGAEPIPHYPPFYVVLVSAIRKFMGANDASIGLLLFLQHVTYVVSVSYAVTILPNLKGRLLATGLVHLGAGIGLYVHGVYSESFAISWMLLASGAVCRVVMGRSRSHLAMMGAALFLGIETRHSLATGAGLAPLALLVMALLEPRRWRRHLVAAALAGVVGLGAILAAQQTTTAVAKAFGNDPSPVYWRAVAMRLYEVKRALPPSDWDALAEQVARGNPVVRAAVEALADRSLTYPQTEAAVQAAQAQAGTGGNPHEILNQASLRFVATLHPAVAETSWQTGLRYFPSLYLENLLSVSQTSIGLYTGKENYRQLFANVRSVNEAGPDLYTRSMVADVARFVDKLPVWALVLAVAVVLILRAKCQPLPLAVVAVAVAMVTLGLVSVMLLALVSSFVPRYGLQLSLPAAIALALVLAWPATASSRPDHG